MANMNAEAVEFEIKRLLGNCRQNKGYTPSMRNKGFLTESDGDRIREAVFNGARQKYLAELFGVSPQYINDIVKGRCLCPPESQPTSTTESTTAPLKPRSRELREIKLAEKPRQMELFPRETGRKSTISVPSVMAEATQRAIDELLVARPTAHIRVTVETALSDTDWGLERVEISSDEAPVDYVDPYDLSVSVPESDRPIAPPDFDSMLPSE